ncbi:MAG TPA: multiheme c-type cytochrome [Gillisia sp.]|nr:multiheme c-type cytochrome [Gillisia sp.]
MINSEEKPEVSDEQNNEQPLPASLDALYPPTTKVPVFLFKMIEMANSLNATGINFFEADYKNMQGSFSHFKTVYTEFLSLVPEWKDYFPLKEVGQLEVALNSMEMERVGLAFENLGKVCHTCHAANMTRVQHKFAWGNFSDISVTDPVNGKENSFSEHMHFMTISYNGITTDLIDGQLEYSRKHFSDFNSRFEAMSETCIVCHESERKYYVDDNIQNMIKAIGEEIAKEKPQVEKIKDLTNGIGYESCYKCHLVHTPAAFSQNKFNKLGGPSTEH